MFSFNQKVINKLHMLIKRLIEIKIGAINLFEKSNEKQSLSTKRIVEYLPQSDSCPLINKTTFIKPEHYLTSISSNINPIVHNPTILSSKLSLKKINEYSRNKNQVLYSSFTMNTNQQDPKETKRIKPFENFHFPTIVVKNQVSPSKMRKLDSPSPLLPETTNFLDLPKQICESPIIKKKIIIVDKNKRKNLHKKKGGNETRAQKENIFELKNDNLRSVVMESDSMSKFKHLFIIKKKH